MKKGDKVKVYNPQALQKLLATQEAQAFAMAFLSFFALAFFTVFAIRPTLTSFFTLRKQIDDASKINEQLDDKINMLLSAQQTYQDYQDEIALLDKALPKDPQFAQIIQKLETIVNENEATTTAFSTTEDVTLLNNQELVKKSSITTNSKNSSEDKVVESAELAIVPIESVNFSMTIGSNYQKNESVVDHLLDLKRIVALSVLEFSKYDSDENDIEVETTLDAKAYFYPEENDK